MISDTCLLTYLYTHTHTHNKLEPILTVNFRVSRETTSNETLTVVESYAS